jgi:uncharacterized membrane protein SpoIIM required for sporulation
MIINLSRFVDEEKPYWEELEATLDKLEKEPLARMGLDEVKRFHYLYRRIASDLGKLHTFASEPEIRSYLESLVARAYGESFESRRMSHRLAPLRWFFHTFPCTFRKYINAFWLSLAVTLIGVAFGGLALTFDTEEAKEVLIPFPHLQTDPKERVKEEESHARKELDEGKSTFSTYLMTHNIQVSVFVFSLGMTFGVGTIILLFYNGIILGAVALDFILAGQTTFLAGWLLPHGVIEIPAILLAGQAGLVLAGALIGWDNRLTLRMRIRQVSADLLTLIMGLAIMLVWAGFVEAFLSQYHEPVIPYSFKIAFGVVELAVLIVFLGMAGKSESK